MLSLLALALALALAMVVPDAKAAATHLLLVGGGDRPALALSRFVDWAGGAQANILVVTWATAYPDEAFHNISGELAPWHPAAVVNAPAAPLDPARRADFLAKLGAATGVFFTGGDQNSFMDAVLANGLGDVLREKYRAGAAFAGTSAGTAVMAERMFTGEGDFTVIDAAKVGTRPGLGLLGGTFIDMHFIRRQRENRLFSLVAGEPATLGIGIDEDTSLAVEDGRRAEVVGPNPVLIVDGSARRGSFTLELLAPGELYDLTARTRTARPSR